jgi:hypothetical protein
MHSPSVKEEIHSNEFEESRLRLAPPFNLIKHGTCLNVADEQSTTGALALNAFLDD